MNNLTNQFIEKVITETDKNNLQWNTLFDFTHHQDLSYLSGFEYTIMTNEFHQVDYTNSYICLSDYFTFLVLNETFISGFDDSISKETNIYISKNKDSEPELLNVSKPLLDELIISCKASSSKGQGSILESIMLNYLDQF